VPPLFQTDGQILTMEDFDKMSDEELYRFLKEKLPAVAQTVRAVNDVNRETIIAFLKFLMKETR
jgi:hypothetical protein